MFSVYLITCIYHFITQCINEVSLKYFYLLWSFCTGLYQFDPHNVLIHSYYFSPLNDSWTWWEREINIVSSKFLSQIRKTLNHMEYYWKINITYNIFLSSLAINIDSISSLSCSTLLILTTETQLWHVQTYILLSFYQQIT